MNAPAPRDRRSSRRRGHPTTGRSRLDALLSVTRGHHAVLCGCIALSLCMIVAACNDAWLYGLRPVPLVQALCGVAAVRRLDGTWNVSRSAGEWSLHCVLPV